MGSLCSGYRACACLKNEGERRLCSSLARRDVPEVTLAGSAHLIGMQSLLRVIYINVLIKGLLFKLGAT